MAHSQLERSRVVRALLAGLLAAGLFLTAVPLRAERALRPGVARLDNGLTVIVQEDHTQPLVSVQVFYRAGARDETNGATGLAHFVEHMACRASENFPGTQIVSRIYAIGGEWHAYTWIDETTFFSTVPAAQLDLALAIEADRMGRLLIPSDEIEAERGAVLTELHGYENSPASRLADAVAAASFVEHPYRNNTVGWTSDVERITREDLVAFYRRYYVPSNAILAIAGDVDPGQALLAAKKAFGSFAPGVRAALPRTVEPAQLGLRRVDLYGGGGRSFFQISYRAPAASDPDFPAFLLLQAILSGSSGANFRQDEEPHAAEPGSRLDGAAPETPEIATWFAPTALPYLFSLRGAAGGEKIADTIEKEIEKRVADLRERPVAAEEFARAREALLAELDLDLETPQDLAHQLAYYEGIGALPVLRRLPELLAAVTPADLQRVAASRLQPWQRTIGWLHGEPPPATAATPVVTPPPPGPRRLDLSDGAGAPSEPTEASRRLRNGIGLTVRRVSRIPAGVLRVVLPADGVQLDATSGIELAVDDPAWHHASILVRFRRGELAAAISRARAALDHFRPGPQPAAESLGDPEERLGRTLRDLLGAGPLAPPAGPLTPVAVVAVGDLGELTADAALAQLDKAFHDLPARKAAAATPLRLAAAEARIALPGRAQSELGYAVPAENTIAWRLLLYMVSHGYEGRFGKDLIAGRGLLYSLDAVFHSDGHNAWISLTAGVNPDRLEAARARFAELLDALRREPPADAEVAEAEEALIGRRATEAKSNREVSGADARDWIEEGRRLTGEEFAARVRAVTRDQVAALVPRFLAGATAVIDVRKAP